MGLNKPYPDTLYYNPAAPTALNPPLRISGPFSVVSVDLNTSKPAAGLKGYLRKRVNGVWQPAVELLTWQAINRACFALSAAERLAGVELEFGVIPKTSDTEARVLIRTADVAVNTPAPGHTIVALAAASRPTFEDRSTGHQIQLTSNWVDFTPIYTMPQLPSGVYTPYEIPINLRVPAIGFRMLVPAGSAGNIAELRFYTAPNVELPYHTFTGQAAQSPFLFPNLVDGNLSSFLELTTAAATSWSASFPKL